MLQGLGGAAKQIFGRLAPGSTLEFKVENLQGLPTEIAAAVSSNNWFMAFFGLVALGVFLRLSAPFLRGLAVLLTAFKRNSDRSEVLRASAQKHLTNSELARNRNDVHNQQLKRTNLINGQTQEEAKK